MFSRCENGRWFWSERDISSVAGKGFRGKGFRCVETALHLSLCLCVCVLSCMFLFGVVVPKHCKMFDVDIALLGLRHS